MKIDLSGKVAFITGAGNGIGAYIAKSYKENNARIVIADIGHQGPPSHPDSNSIIININVTDPESVKKAVEYTIEKWGKIDILISNAGIQIINPIEDISFSDWKKMISVHLDGAFLTTQAVLKHMYKDNKGGSIIYMGSVHSKEASILKAPYVTAKHGLIGLARVVSKEGASHNVRANVICPGFVRTALVDKQIPEQAKNLHISEEEVIKKIMLAKTIDGNFTSLEDVADVALFFAAFPSNALTGQSLLVSHGWCME